MKVLVVMRHSGYVRNFESALRLLADRGHTIQLAFQKIGTHWLLDPLDVAQQLCDEYPRVSRTLIPMREDAWGFSAQEYRAALDYLRYLVPAYRDAPKLRARAELGVPQSILTRAKQGLFSSPMGHAVMARALRALEGSVPTDPAIDAYLLANRPDVLIVTPLIEPGAPQAEYVRSARALGIRTALCVASWDNLTNKGLIHGDVDLVTVWNEAMKREAMDFHGVPAERIAVTGAQPFDQWFAWKPSIGRDAFCQRVGLPADTPYLLYLCSSRFIAPDEGLFVRRWAQALRQSGHASLRDVGLLVRPHPQNADHLREIDFSDCGPLVVWPQGGATPSHHASKTDFFDSIYHSAAAVGVNTTAEIESAIVGRRVFTVLAPEFRETQGGTLHFEHLRRQEGGLVEATESLADHCAQLDAAIRDGAGDGGDGGDRRRRFLETFVRPHGMNVPATPRLADAIEALGRADAPSPRPAPWWAPLVRPVAWSRGDALQREALRAREAKAAKARRKKPVPADDGPPAATGDPRADARTDARTDSRPESRTESRGSARPDSRASGARTWQELTQAFRALGYQDRVRFGHATFDMWPGELLLDNARPERLDYPDADILLRVVSKQERERLKACAKEPFTIEWIHQWIQPGEVLYDIGANVGAYALVAAKKPGGGARVFAFEPGYANVSSLCANIVLNQAGDDVTPVPVALADVEAMNELGLRVLEPGGARHTLGGETSDDGPVLYRQPVLTYRLDDFIERFALPLPAHVKLDVDGSELAVISGASKTLASPSIRSLLVEVDTNQSAAVVEALERHRLFLDTKVDVQNTAGEHRVWYGLFTREAKPNGQPHIRQMTR